MVTNNGINITTQGTVYYNGTGTFSGVDGGASGHVLTSNGTGVAPTFQASGGGGGITTINGTSGSVTGSTVTFTGSTSGAVFTGSGTTMTESFNYLTTATSDSGGVNGVISIGSGGYAGGTAVNFHSFGNNLSPNSNVFIGFQPGNFTNTSANNVGIGTQAMLSLTSSSNNCGMGLGSLASLAGGSGGNCAIGNNSLLTLVTGTSNVGIGQNVGSNYVGAESSNILILNAGTASESNVIRIGTSGSGGGQQNKCFLAGVNGVTVTGTAVLCSTAGQLGTIASSIRYKENVIPMGKTSVLDLNPVTFNYKTDNSKAKQYGLIAEEVEKIMPDLVFYGDDGKPESVLYHTLPVLLLNEIKKLHERVNYLTEKLNEKCA
jgi:Chaperone of endosialidase